MSNNQIDQSEGWNKIFDWFIMALVWLMRNIGKKGVEDE